MHWVSLPNLFVYLFIVMCDLVTRKEVSTLECQQEQFAYPKHTHFTVFYPSYQHIHPRHATFSKQCQMKVISESLRNPQHSQNELQYS